MTLFQYSQEVHKANQKWWLDLNKPCQRCDAKGSFGSENPCSACGGHKYLYLERNFGEMCMLTISELSDALEGNRKNLWDDKLPQYRMVDVEIVDAFIRMFDIAGAYNSLMDRFFTRFNKLNDYPSLDKKGPWNTRIPEEFYSKLDDPNNFGESLLAIVRSIVNLYNNAFIVNENFYRPADYDMASVFNCLFRFSKTYGLNLDDVYEAKMAYNAQREDHSIEHRLSEQGKKY